MKSSAVTPILRLLFGYNHIRWISLDV
uniref:Uncharacterized protein n=1 Tax=Arundo donax TaxID=35708 RepID=A0A0A9BN57_ARUDO